MPNVVYGDFKINFLVVELIDIQSILSHAGWSPVIANIDEEEMDDEHVKYISYYCHHQADIDDDDEVKESKTCNKNEDWED